MNYVLSPTALDLLLSTDHGGNQAWPPSVEWCKHGNIFSVSDDRQCTYLITPADVLLLGGRLLISSRCTDRLQGLDARRLRTTLERLNRLLHASRHPPLRLPLSYSEFHADNKVAFFALPPASGSWRWIAATLRQQDGDVFLFDYSEPDSPARLQDVAVDLSAARSMVEQWASAVSKIPTGVPDAEGEADAGTIQPSVDLDAITFDAVARHRDYSAWYDLLTEKQRSFVLNDTDRSVRLRGPAGSGKTLALVMKAVRAVQRSADRGEDIRVLFATASWAMAEQVDAIIQQLDLGEARSIDILPLIQLAKDLPGTTSVAGTQNLGEDSLDGRRRQLDLIDSILGAFATNVWPFQKRGCTGDFSYRFDAAQGTNARKMLVWDLMHEFSSVIAANGILPGTQAERKYLEVVRRPWMMPVTNTNEKRIVLRLYVDYVESLRRDRLRSIDQIVSDCLSYVETFAWNIRRREDGYDVLFVDEFHLFSEQEQILLHSLSRNPEDYARLYTASDPDQSPFEYFLGVAAKQLLRRDSGELGHLSDRYSVVDLPDIHRFTPEILALVRHVHNTFPVFDLGTSLRTDLSDVVSRVLSGEKPVLAIVATREEEVSTVRRRTSELLAERRRVAIVVVDPNALEEYEKALQADRKVSVLRSRDDIDGLRYTKTGVTLAAAEYVAGLQFDSVIVAGLPATDASGRESTHEKRRAMSLLYLAITRASRYAEIVVNRESGVPELFVRAAAAGVFA